MRGSYHLVWHPQIIDYGLNRCPGAASIDDIVGDRKFMRASQHYAAASEGSFGAGKVTADILWNISHREATDALGYYLAAQTNRAIRVLKCVDRSPTAREEIFATIRHQYLAQAGEFRPGADAENGTFRSFGYAAYHQRFIPKAWHEITKVYSAERLLQRLPKRNDDAGSWSDQVDAGAREVDTRFTRLNLIGFKNVLADSLRSALCETQSWDVFHAMIYRGETASSLATRLSLSQGHISDAITNKILNALRSPLASFYDCASPRRIRITELREPLCDLLPESDFLALIPRPLPSLPRPLNRGRQSALGESRTRVGRGVML